MATMTPDEALEILRGLHLRCECTGKRVVQDAAGIAVDAIVEGERLRARIAELEGRMKPSRWWRVLTPEGKVWCETSGEKGAREEMRAGYKLQRLYGTEVAEWRDET